MKKLYSIQKLVETNDPWDSHDDILGIYEKREEAEKELSVLRRYWQFKGEAECYAPKIVEMEVNPPMTPHPTRFRAHFEGNEENDIMFIYAVATPHDNSDTVIRTEENFKITKSILKDDGYHKFQVKFYLDVIIPIEEQDTREGLLKKLFNKVTKDGYKIIK